MHVDVAKCHACHAKSRGVHGVIWEPSTPPEPAQCHQCHACHAKWRSMSPSPTPATQDARRCRQVPRLPRKEPRRPRRHLGTKHATRASPVPSAPRLPRKVTVDVTKCHACHAKWKWMSPSATPATVVCVDKLCVSNVGSWLVWGPPRGLDCSVLCDGSAGEEIEHSMKHARILSCFYDSWKGGTVYLHLWTPRLLHQHSLLVWIGHP